jgi:ribosome biogenesis protein ENP2
LEAKLGNTRKRRGGGQGGKGGEGEIRLIQDFDFPEASNKIRSTRDGQYLLATGTYKPQMRVFDLEELSMKTQRVTDSENVDFCVRSLLSFCLGGNREQGKTDIMCDDG